MPGKKEEKIRKSLSYSITDGSLYSVMAGFGEFYLGALAVFLGATNLQLGLLTSGPQFLGSIAQLWSYKLLRFMRSKKKIILLFVFLQSLVWLPLAFLIYTKIYNLVWIILLLVALYWITGMIIGPIWSIFMSDLVDITHRGKYFGKRNRIVGIISLFSFITAGLLLHYNEYFFSSKLSAFSTLFIIAFIARLVSLIFFAKQYEVSKRVVEKKISFKRFVSHLTKDNNGLLVLYLCLFNFSLFIAAPFFVAYMLNDLNFSYFQFMAAHALALLSKFIFMPIWGNLSDKHGSLRILQTSGYMIPIIPIMWVVSPNFYYICIVQIFAGIAWAGFELSSFNFILDTMHPKIRTQNVAYYNVLRGVALVAGSLLGALIVRYNSIFWSRYILVFLFSGISRQIVSSLFLPKLKEIRPIEEISYKNVIWKLFTSINTIGYFHNIFHLKKGER